MAAVDRRNLNLDDFVGLNWSCWVDRVNIVSSDAGCNAEDSQNATGGPETMTLRKEDMNIFGHCPAHDEFFLVVCSHCGLVVKPQAFEKHCERLHGPVMWMCGQSSAQAHHARPSSSSTANSCVRRQKDGCDVSTAALSVQRSRPPNHHKETVSLSSGKFSEEKPPLLHLPSSTPHPRVPPWPSAPPPPGDSSSSSSSSSSTALSERLSIQRSAAGQSTEPPCSLRGMRTYSRMNKSLNKKESEPNKLCSGPGPEKKKLSTRDSICNTDSIHQRQQKESADEQRAASAGRDTEQLPVKSKEKLASEVDEKRSTQGGSYHILRSKAPSESFPEGKGGSAVEVEVKPAHSFNHGLLSSEGSEEEEEEEAADLPATAWHPKPLGLCTFGCRALGCSIFTFDRRLHRLRFALSAMLERHVSSHMWKKMPQVSSGLRSHRVTPPLIGTAVRSGEKPSTGSCCVQSTSVGQLETKSSHQNSHSTKRPYSSTAARPPPARRCNLAGKPGTTQPRKGAADPRRSSEDKSPRYIRDRPLHEKSQPHTFSSEEAACGSPPRVKKPCRPLSLNPSERSSLPAPTHCAPRSKRRPPGAQCGVLDYDHRPFVQKRKGGGDSLGPGPQLPKTPKYKCLPSPSRSSMVSMETIEDVLGWGLEKRADM